jgi:hypothetical protein
MRYGSRDYSKIVRRNKNPAMFHSRELSQKSVCGGKKSRNQLLRRTGNLLPSPGRFASSKNTQVPRISEVLNKFSCLQCGLRLWKVRVDLSPHGFDTLRVSRCYYSLPVFPQMCIALVRIAME